MRLLVLASCALLVACASSPAARPRTALAEVATARGVHGHVLVPVQLAGKSTRFLLDSGASADGVSPAFANELGLARTGAAEAVAAGGKLGEVPLVTLPQMQVGGVVLPRHQGSVEDFDPEDPGVGGIFGRDFFQRHDVEVDLGRDRLRLLPAGSSRARAELAAPAFTRIPFADARGLMKIAVRVDDGAAIDAIVDLGATQSVANAEAAKASGFDPPLEQSNAAAVGADGRRVPVLPHAFKTVRLGDIVVPSPTFVVGDLPVFDELGLKGPAMIVGLDLLARRTIVFDTTNGEIVLSMRGG